MDKIKEENFNSKLPEKDHKKKKTLFLDLDETLVHVQFDEDNDEINSKNDDWSIYIRPYCNNFLKNVSKFYEIFIYTAAEKSYAKQAINYVDPKKQYIDGILFRDQCAITKCGKTIKDLKFIKNREIKDMILVDNLVTNFGSSIENGIPFLDFYDNPDDDQLLYLEKFLIDTANFDDVRDSIKEKFSLKETFELMFV